MAEVDAICIQPALETSLRPLTFFVHGSFSWLLVADLIVVDNNTEGKGTVMYWCYGTFAQVEDVTGDTGKIM